MSRKTKRPSPLATLFAELRKENNPESERLIHSRIHGFRCASSVKQVWWDGEKVAVCLAWTDGPAKYHYGDRYRKFHAVSYRGERVVDGKPRDNSDYYDAMVGFAIYTTAVRLGINVKWNGDSAAVIEIPADWPYRALEERRAEMALARGTE